jgi:hypothetical protein
VATVADRQWVAEGRIDLPAARRVDAGAWDDDAGDFLGTAMPWVMLGVTLLPFIVLGLWLVLAYVGIEFGAPPMNTHSVPPPLLY